MANTAAKQIAKAAEIVQLVARARRSDCLFLFINEGSGYHGRDEQRQRDGANQKQETSGKWVRVPHGGEEYVHDGADNEPNPEPAISRSLRPRAKAWADRSVEPDPCGASDQQYSRDVNDQYPR